MAPLVAGPRHPSHCGFLFDSRCYCFECVDTLVGPGTSGKVQALSNWVCFLCLPLPSSGLLRRRPKWRGRLKAFYDREAVSGRAWGRGSWRPGGPGCEASTALPAARSAL